MKRKVVGLWCFLVFLVLISMLNNEQSDMRNSRNQKIENDINKIDNEVFLPKPPKDAGYVYFREWIYVSDNWSDTAAAYEWCYFENYYYVIENVTIGASNSPFGSGILIENSVNDYFIIRNNTIFNAWGSFFGGGITLLNTNNGTIKNNNLTNNVWGITLENANNNNVTDNIIENSEFGIAILEGYNNTIKNNNLTNCGIIIIGTLQELVSNIIDTSNKIAQRPVYYYVNETNLRPVNFTNAGQIMLFYSNHSQISNVNTSYGSAGIQIENCLNITITNSNSSYNTYGGIYIANSENITVSNSWMIKNRNIGLDIFQSSYSNISFNYYESSKIGINLEESYNNTFKNNTMVRCGFYTDDDTASLLNYTIDTSNTVNGNPVYYYKDKLNLYTPNFTYAGNPGQIILINSNQSSISNFNLSKGSYGILIYFSNNITIFNNNVSFSKKIGIYIKDSSNITLSYNEANYCEYGIWFIEGENNTISNNSASHNEELGIALFFIDNTNMDSNNVTHNGKIGLKGTYQDGLYISFCTNINITNSIITHNFQWGLKLRSSIKLLLENNNISYNMDGINFHNTDDSIIKRNNFMNNTRYGIFVQDDDAQNNLIYNNTFIGNGVKHAYDIFGYNRWNGTIGNFWDDYDDYGFDSNDDGIGDISYKIDPFFLAEDERPIFWDAPDLVVVEPVPFQLYGNNSPFYLVFIYAGIEDSVWYTLGNDPTIYNITDSLLGFIIQTGWDNLDNGTVIIHFYVNDSRGYIENENIPVLKDSIAPYITINEPKDGMTYNDTVPLYNLTFIDAHLNDTWYRLWNGTKWSKNYTISGIGSERAGQIEQGAWNDCPNGTVIIEFYANDTLGNLRVNSTTILKDILGPLITIINPTLNELFSSTAPGVGDCNVDFDDGNGISKRWYMLINATNSNYYTINYSWSDEVNQIAWDQMGNGTVIIRIFANDTLGNVGQAEVVVRKDIIPPYITIIDPVITIIYNATAPFFSIFLTGLDLNTTWYRVYNGSVWSINYTIGGSGSLRTGQIDQNAWNDCPNGTVLIEFYANDTVDNIEMNSTTVKKDNIAPYITIILPVENQAVSRSPPTFNVSIIEGNIHTKWYRLFNGTNYSKNFTFTEDTTINKTSWEKMWDSISVGDNITITFYCNDTAGNLGFVNVIVLKQVSQAAPPSVVSGDNDGGKKAKKEEFDIIEFLTSQVGLTIMGGSVVGVIIISIILKKKLSYRRRIKEIEKIERIKK